MALSVIIDNFSRESWENWSKTFQSANIYQTWEYGFVHSRGLGRSVSRAVLLDDAVPLAMVQFRIKKIPLLKIGVAEANWGPLFDIHQTVAPDECLSHFLTKLKTEYSYNRGLDLKFELRGRPNELLNEKISGFFSDNHLTFLSEERAYRTIILDLSIGLGALRLNLNGKWRNSLTNSEKSGLSYEYGTSPELFDRFLKIYDKMWARKKFATGVRMHAIHAYQKIASDLNKLRVAIVKDNGNDIAAGTFSGLGDTMMYFLGATDPDCRKNTNPGYFVQWLSIQKSIEDGFKWYDMGGLNELKDSTVDMFKTRMGGSRIVYPGWYIHRVASNRSRIFDSLEASYRLIRSRGKQL